MSLSHNVRNDIPQGAHSLQFYNPVSWPGTVSPAFKVISVMNFGENPNEKKEFKAMGRKIGLNAPGDERNTWTNSVMNLEKI